jgi:hypothetical protein
MAFIAGGFGCAAVATVMGKSNFFSFILNSPNADKFFFEPPVCLAIFAFFLLSTATAMIWAAVQIIEDQYTERNGG